MTKEMSDFVVNYVNIMTELHVKPLEERFSNVDVALSDLMSNVQRLTASLPQRHEFSFNNVVAPRQVEGIVHPVFDKVMIHLVEHEPVYLHGPAGSGKNVLAEQCAKALGVEFYSASTLLQKYELLGYGDANGNYRDTSFYKAFVNGGLFFLDEFDGCSSEVAIALNGALANYYEDFPIEGFKRAANDFYIIAAGNTVARGANELYNGRFQLDAATIDRFSFIKVDYYKPIELQLANGDDELVDFIHEVREVCETKGIQLVAGYRAVRKIAKFKSKLPLKEVLESELFKGLDRQDREMIKPYVSSFKYREAI